MSHSFACQNTSGHDGGRPASTPWTYVSEPSRTAGTTHAAAMINQSRPIFTRRRYLPGESWGDAGSEWLYRCSRRSKASARINADGKQPRTHADRQSACRQLDSVPGHPGRTNRPTTFDQRHGLGDSPSVERPDNGAPRIANARVLRRPPSRGTKPLIRDPLRSRQQTHCWTAQSHHPGWNRLRPRKA